MTQSLLVESSTLLLKTGTNAIDLPIIEVVIRAVVNVVSTKIQVAAATCPPFIDAYGDNIVGVGAIIDYSIGNHCVDEDRAKEDRHYVHASFIADDRLPSIVLLFPSTTLSVCIDEKIETFIIIMTI